MAGTRLAAHTFFLLFSLVSVLIAWRLGVVKRAPLPLEKMASLGLSSPLSSSWTPQALLLPVDIDVVLLRSPTEDCPSCAATLDAIKANPSLARNAFREVEATETAKPTAESSPENNEGRQNTPLFTIREVNLRVVVMHNTVDNQGRRMCNQAERPPVSDAAALDDWLLRSLVVQPQRDTTLAAATSATIASSSDSPRYTFFVGCDGGGDGGELPTFTMGKHRHGYLGLGCECSCDASDGNDETAAKHGRMSLSSPTAIDGVSATAHGSGGDREAAAAAAADLLLASSAAFAVLQALAGIILAHVLVSPVPAGDVHVRPGQAYRLNFSLLSEDPSLRRCTWDFAGASRRYLRPLLRKLNPVASFAVQSQEVQYARLTPAPPQYHSSKKRWFYSPRDLQGFLGANDFSSLDLAAGWGSGETVSAGGGRNATSDVSPPQSQVPVNFMIFCPSPTTSPLVFMEDWAGAGGGKKPAAGAYEVPGFGGVSVANCEGDGDAAVDVLGPDRLRRALGAHVSQLRRIIGLPRPSDRPSDVPWPRVSPQQDQPDKEAGGGRDSAGSRVGGANLCGSCPVSARASRKGRRRLPLSFLPSPADGVTDWEVDALIRAGLARNRAAAAETLRSLAALVESQPEMEVSAKVAEDVTAAIAALAKVDIAVLEATNIRASEEYAEAERWAGGRTTGEGKTGVGDGVAWACGGAMRWAREALRRSEAAYFDPTMVPQLYFPQDHLMAVYLPFLGPLAFPLLWGFAQELWRYRKKLQAKHDGKADGDAVRRESDENNSGDKKSDDGAIR